MVEGKKDMELIGNILIIMLLVLIFVFAVLATIRGYKSIKMSKCFETTNNKVKIGYKIASAIHMCAGILIILFYVIAGVWILT